MKTWLEIRTATLGLGFEKTKAYEKNKQAYVDAYNWARTFIAAAMGGITEILGLEKENKNACTVDLWTQSEKTGRKFSSVARTGITDENGNRLKNVYVTDNRYLQLPRGFTGKINVYFTALPRDITIASPDDTQCPLPEKWTVLIPYLMANRLYLDDDRGKAGYYWNQFEDMKNSMLAMENIPTIIVNGGVDIDVF